MAYADDIQGHLKSVKKSLVSVLDISAMAVRAEPDEALRHYYSKVRQTAGHLLDSIRAFNALRVQYERLAQEAAVERERGLILAKRMVDARQKASAKKGGSPRRAHKGGKVKANGNR